MWNKTIALALSRVCRILCYAAFITFAFASLWQGVCHAFFIGGVSLKDEKEMGRKFDTALRSNLAIVDDPEVSQYIADILKRLVKALPPQPFDFRSAVVLNNGLNAFAVPGGYVYVFSGMIMNVENEAELAGIMAHELAHVTQRHVAARMERAQYLTLGSLLVAIAGIALGGAAGMPAALTAAGAGQAAMLNYSRLDESEADNLGLQYLAKAGYPPSGMVGGFRAIRKKSWMNGTNVPTYLSTHPAIGDRMNSLSARIGAMPKTGGQRFDNSRFTRVKTLLWARHGDTQVALTRFNGKDGLSLMGKGIVLSRLNRVPEAKKAFEAALRAAPDDALIMREAGIFNFRKGDMAEAERLLKNAMARDRNDYMASFFYGRLLDESGRQKQAAEYYKNVLRHVPEDPEVHEAFARSLASSGDNYLAHIHLAYGAIYANNKKLAEKYFRQAKAIADKAKDRRPFERLQTAYKERKQIWENS